MNNLSSRTQRLSHPLFEKNVISRCPRYCQVLVLARENGFCRREKVEVVLEQERMPYKRNGISKPSIEDFSINDIDLSVKY